jgi:aminoglycoside 3-N-acetyltransferase
MPDVTFRDLQRGLRDLGLDQGARVIVHASLPAFGAVRGGAGTLVAALSSLCELAVTPVFTPQCRVWPRVGPPHNGASYTGHDDDNANAEIFRAGLPADPALGAFAEALRTAPGALRSGHPLYSFAALGEGAGLVTAAQTLAEPLGPIAHLAAGSREASVLLLGVDHTANIALHFAEWRAGRKQFVRWALTPGGAVECPGCPGCPDGFNAITPELRGISRVGQIGSARVECLPLNPLLRLAETFIRRDPEALLCSRRGCERCGAVRTVQAALAPAQPA